MITFKSIGIINTPYKTKEGIPIQAAGAIGIKGHIVLNEDLQPGLADLDGFSHIILLYHFHKSMGFELQLIPFLDKEKRGVFSTRAPKRPNPIGMSVVRLLSIDENILSIENVDILDGTPLIDIKPYISDFDVHEVQRNGWIANKTNKLKEIKSDRRFE